LAPGFVSGPLLRTPKACPEREALDLNFDRAVQDVFVTTFDGNWSSGIGCLPHESGAARSVPAAVRLGLAGSSVTLGGAGRGRPSARATM